jgi:hypothetical protein
MAGLGGHKDKDERRRVAAVGAVVVGGEWRRGKVKLVSGSRSPIASRSALLAQSVSISQFLVLFLL